jgi:hypothetical protein
MKFLLRSAARSAILLDPAGRKWASPQTGAAREPVPGRTISSPWIYGEVRRLKSSTFDGCHNQLEWEWNPDDLAIDGIGRQMKLGKNVSHRLL